MKKKIRREVEEVAARLCGIVPDRGQRSVMGAPRAEVAALATGMASGIAYMIEVCDEGMDPLFAGNAFMSAVALVTSALEDWPEHRDGLLSQRATDAAAAALVGVRHGDE